MKHSSMPKTELSGASVPLQRNVRRGRLRFRKQRRGAMIVLCAVSMIVLLALAMLLVDVAWMSVIQTEAQVASDLAARSSLTAYANDQSGQDFDYRKARAKRIGELVFESSNIGRGSIDISPDDIQLGVQDSDGTIAQDRGFANASLVDFPTVGNGFGFFLAPMFGHDRFDTGARSLASYSSVDIVLCVDMSRSMVRVPGSGAIPPGATLISPNANLADHPPLPGSRWVAANDSIVLFLNKAEVQAPTLRVGMVTFGGGERKRVDSPWDDSATRVSADLDLIGQGQKNNINSALDFITNNTLGINTPTLEGLELSLQHLQARSNKQTDRMIILLTDGRPTSGDPLPTANDIAAEGITIHTIYFSGGRDSADDLKALSDAAGGLNLRPDNQTELDNAFDQILALLSVRLVE